MSQYVKAVLKDGMHLEASTPSGDWIIPMDSDTSVGGQDKGHRPLDLILTGLIGCMSMDAISILRKKRQEFTLFEAEVIGVERNGEHPKTFTDLRLHFKVGGAHVTAEAIERALELSYTKYCPAAAMLKPTVKITYSYEIVQPEPSIS